MRKMDTEAQDRALIATFAWAADDSPLPVNPDDPAQLLDARRWASDQAQAVRESGAAYTAISLFLSAVKRQYWRLRLRELDALAAWNAGAPIRKD